ncbi:MAG: hypothetical protein B7X90_02760 [Novosphingobium sp. 17-62-19]|uniref:DUF3034 family protein n=1 Tax=Novosphingobium sp. 17-62-19 TaxID=1970406 RepID=UPI000BD34457|nr:DUF3034 family protein [Novosphingobium sp. 17-62-19]OZA21174.1 MAG: hypothetical protein B7X90_02760 [Novosphingobium sp. 17-62-19]
MHIHSFKSCILPSLGLMLVAAPPANADPLLDGGKLVLTNGISSIEGASGGGLASWATIAGMETDRGVGVSAHVTGIELADYGWQSHGASVGIKDRVELSYARQNFDTRKVGAALGLGEGYRFNQDIFAAKVRLVGDTVYGSPLLPQISLGVQHKRSLDAAIVKAVGAASSEGTDFTASATKLFLSKSVLVNATARLTNANQFGLLGFGGANQTDRTLQFEGSVAYMLTPRLVVGGEYRTRPSNLAIAREDDAHDLFVAWAITRNATVTAAYADVGSVATFDGQRGGLVSLQFAF